MPFAVFTITYHKTIAAKKSGIDNLNDSKIVSNKKELKFAQVEHDGPKKDPKVQERWFVNFGFLVVD